MNFWTFTVLRFLQRPFQWIYLLGKQHSHRCWRQVEKSTDADLDISSGFHFWYLKKTDHPGWSTQISQKEHNSSPPPTFFFSFLSRIVYFNYLMSGLVKVTVYFSKITNKTQMNNNNKIPAGKMYKLCIKEKKFFNYLKSKSESWKILTMNS